VPVLNVLVYQGTHSLPEPSTHFQFLCSNPFVAQSQRRALHLFFKHLHLLGFFTHFFKHAQSASSEQDLVVLASHVGLGDGFRDGDTLDRSEGGAEGDTLKRTLGNTPGRVVGGKVSVGAAVVATAVGGMVGTSVAAVVGGEVATSTLQITPLLSFQLLSQVSSPTSLLFQWTTIPPLFL